MRDYFLLDTSKYPLVTGAFEDFLPTADEFRKWQSDMEAFNALHDNYVLLIDFSKIQILSIEYRIMAARWASKHDRLFIDKNITMIFYTPSLVVQVMMKAIIFLTKPKAKYYLTINLKKAHAHAAQILQANEKCRS